jgi:hypothetical protein
LSRSCTGINRKLIREAIDARVESCTSSGAISVRQRYEAVGVYETDGKLELALGGRDIAATRGTEPGLFWMTTSRIPVI